jgi:hypothetical protein
VRTTLTLDADVAARLKVQIRQHHQPLRAVVNNALRAGLALMEKRPETRAPHRTTGFDLVGPSRVGSLDNVEDVLSRVVGERRR